MNGGTLASPIAALLSAALFTLVLRWETRRARWSPFFLFHAFLAIALPLAAGAWPPGHPIDALAAAPREWLALALALAAWELGVAGFAYEAWLGRRGFSRDPAVSPAAALDAVLRNAAARFGLPPAAANGLFSAYAVLWAPLGEDLLFWGYWAPSLATAWGYWPAAGAAALLFGYHHRLYLGGPGGGAGAKAGFAFAATSAVSGILLASIYRASHSLFPVMAAHAAVNLAWITASGLRAPQR